MGKMSSVRLACHSLARSVRYSCDGCGNAVSSPDASMARTHLKYEPSSTMPH